MPVDTNLQVGRRKLVAGSFLCSTCCVQSVLCCEAVEYSQAEQLTRRLHHHTPEQVILGGSFLALVAAGVAAFSQPPMSLLAEVGLHQQVLSPYGRILGSKRVRSRQVGQYIGLVSARPLKVYNASFKIVGLCLQLQNWPAVAYRLGSALCTPFRAP